MKMKRFILTVLCFAVFTAMEFRGAPVSSGRALELASQVLAPSTRSGAAGLRVLWTGEAPSETPALYVIGRQEGGFVIVAGDDRVFPVLAISESGSFKVEDMPGNVRWWMERMEAYVRTVRIPEPQAEIAWSERTRSAVLPDAEITDRVERLTPEWDQGNNDQYYFGRNVFNAKCPQSGGQLTLVGCTATALAEILTYQSGQTGVRMPDAAKGVIESYNVYSGYITPTFPYELGTRYDWEGLRSLLGIQAIREALSAGQEDLVGNLAQLMADLGAIVQAAYSVNGTSASVELSNLVACLDINKQAHIEYQSSYSDRRWVEMLKTEIDRRPLLYAGDSATGGGHQFIFDGYGKYAGEDVFHVNFGWGGYCNGYYRHFNLENDGGRNYVYSCRAVFDFYPDPDSAADFRLVFLPSTGSDGTEYYGLSTSKKITAGHVVTLCLGAVENYSPVAFTGSFRVVQKDRDGQYVGEPLLTWSYNIKYRHYTRMQRSFYAPAFSFGDRLVLEYTKDAEGKQWEAVSYPNDGNVVGELPMMPASFIRTEKNYSVGDYFAFALKNNDVRYAGTVWTVTAPDGIKTQYRQSDWEFLLNQAGKYKIEAAVAPAEGAAVTEHLVTYITVK